MTPSIFVPVTYPSSESDGNEYGDFSSLEDNDELADDRWSNPESNHFVISDDEEHQSEDESDDEFLDIGESDNEMIYEGAKITVAESLTALLCISLSFKITGVLMANIISLILLHCREPNKCVKSLYYFKKFFSNIRAPLIKHHFCAKCMVLVLDSTCITCGPDADIKYFIEIPILAQLSLLFKRPGFYDKIQHRFFRKKINDDNLEDIYDGSVYKKMVSDGFLSNKNNISFTWNSDGVPIFKSSKFAIWPLYLVINELPPSMRFRRENFILAGLWFGNTKPEPNLFLSVFKEGLKKLYQGVRFRLPNGTFINVRGLIICGTCDLPAKAIFLNFKQYNSKYGCPKCTTRSEHINRVPVYHFSKSLDMRTSEETLKIADRVRGKPISGVKGHSFLSRIVHDYVETTAVDVMHCVFINLGKRLLSIWFDSRYHDHPGSLRKHRALINERLVGIKPPHFVPRRPRCLDEQSYWKASEMKWFLLAYSIPILHDVMSGEFLSHHILLISAVTTLMSTSISVEMLQSARSYLSKYVEAFETLYGEEHMSCNLHQLLHLAETVEQFGPLFVTSCFAFENLNGILKGFVKGSNHPELQIYSSYAAFFRLMQMKNDYLTPDCEVLKFCDRILDRSKRKLKVSPVTSGEFVVGCLSRQLDLEENIKQALGVHYNINCNVYSFSRILKNGILYETEKYSGHKLRDSSYIIYQKNNENQIGRIQAFLKVDKPDGTFHISAMINQYVAQEAFPCGAEKWPLSTIFLSYEIQDMPMIAIEIGDIVSVCFSINIDGLKFIVLPANTIEME